MFFKPGIEREIMFLLQKYIFVLQNYLYAVLKIETGKDILYQTDTGATGNG